MSDNKNKPVVNEFQPSMTEWFAQIGEEKESEAFRKEDNYKVERLEALYQAIGLAYERPEEFPARELVEKSPRFTKLLEERGDEPCAIRLVPRRDDLPKIRNRGLTLRECYTNWFLKQDINPDEYRAFVCPHTDELLWSAIFVVKEDVIFGEIVRGLAVQLTHGNTQSKVFRFRFDFHNFEWNERDLEAEREIIKMLELIYVPDKNKQTELITSLDAKFSHDYLCGYFETTVWPGDITYIIDYNRLLAKYITTPGSFKEKTGDVVGMPAFPGRVEGIARIIDPENISSVIFDENNILVADNTDVRFIPIMKKAGAIVTNRGGILSHASIIARELKKPCIVGAGNATQVLKDGDVIEVDADRGSIKIIKKQMV
ncbi:MAG: PEP-utilizing enzyme [Patescibacteria group bacterium]